MASLRLRMGVLRVRKRKRRWRGSRGPLELGCPVEGVVAAAGGAGQTGDGAGTKESFDLLLALLERGEVGFVSRKVVWIVRPRGAAKIQRGRGLFRCVRLVGGRQLDGGSGTGSGSINWVESLRGGKRQRKGPRGGKKCRRTDDNRGRIC
jgi:hypothetical protein